MMPSRGLKPPRCISQTPIRRPHSAYRYRKIALSPPRPYSTSSYSQSSLQIKTPWRVSFVISRSVLNPQTSRFASTGSAIDKTTTSDSSEPVPLTTDEFSTPSIGDITSDLPLVPETIGYLKGLGLDFGWGPTALVEYLLEHVHIYTATPWWASIILTALAVRIVLLKPYIDAADVSARMATVADLLKPIKARMDAAKSTKDQAALMQAYQEMTLLYREAGIKMWKVAVPLLQIPIGFGTFRLLSRMAALPVPGLEDGGFLWLKDLTISDPFWILPALTGLGIHLTFKAGGELGNTTTMNPAFAKFALYGMPVVGGGFMLMYPACLQLTFGFTAALSLIQAYLFRQPWVRERLGIQPLPKRNPESSAPTLITSTSNIYQPPSLAPPTPEMKSGIANKAREKMSDAKGAASELLKSVKSFTGSAKKDPRTTSRLNLELDKAQAVQGRRLNRVAQARSEAEQTRNETAAERWRRPKGERH